MNATLEKHWFFAGFSRVFFLWFYHFLHRLTGLAWWQNVTPARARGRRARARVNSACAHMHPFPWSFHLGGIAGVRSLSISQELLQDPNLRAGEVAKASLLPGVLAVPPTPPLSVFFESHLKKRRSRLHFGAFLHLEGFQFGEKWIFTKILHAAGVLAFFGDLGGIKKSSKNEGNSPKNHGSGKEVFRDGFWSIFGPFFFNFQFAKHCKIQCFCNFFVLKDNNVKCCKNTGNTDVFEGPCAENTVNTVVFGATCKKPRTYRVFCAFWLKSIGIYGVFWSPSAENCVNSMVLARFWTSGKQKLLVFTGFCERNAWKTFVFLQGFHAFFSYEFMWFYHFLHRLTGLACWQNVTRVNSACAHLHPFPWSFHLGGIAGVRSLSISQELLQDPCLRFRSYSILLIRFCDPAQAKRKFWPPETRFVRPCAGKTVRPRSAGAFRAAQGKQSDRVFRAGETQILNCRDAFFVALRRRNANFDLRRRIFCPDEVDSRGVRTGWTKSPRRYSETRKNVPGRSLAQAKRKFWPPESRFLWPCAVKNEADKKKAPRPKRLYPYRKNPSVWHTVWGKTSNKSKNINQRQKRQDNSQHLKTTTQLATQGTLRIPTPAASHRDVIPPEMAPGFTACDMWVFKRL